MAISGKPNRTGRSSGAYSARGRKTFGPPTDEPWIWFPTVLLYSTPWRATRLNTRKLIDFLMIEHRNHAGLENGNLKATHGQLVAHGPRRENIRDSIDEAEALGLVRVARASRRRATHYGLTFYASAGGTPPTNEWKAVDDDDVQRWRGEMVRRNIARRAKRKKQKSSAETGTSVVPKPAPVHTVH